MKTFDHQSGSYLSVGSAKIYYEFAGVPDKPILLVLHGGFGTFEDINILLEKLGEDFTLLGIDSRGHGKSTMGTEGLNYQLIQNDVEQVLQYLKIDKLNIIGFSDGGVVGYRLATFIGLQIEKLVTIDSRWHYDNVEAASEAMTNVTAEGWKSKFPDTFFKYQELNPEPDFEELAKALKQMWFDDGPSGYPNQAVANFQGSLLIIRGDNDPLLSLKDVTALKQTLKNAAFLNVPFAGHAPFSTHHKLISPVLSSFFELG